MSGYANRCASFLDLWLSIKSALAGKYSLVLIDVLLTKRPIDMVYDYAATTIVSCLLEVLPQDRKK